MSIDPRGPVLPILGCCLVVVFLIVAMDAAPASVPVIAAASPQAPPPMEISNASEDSGVIIFTDSAPDSPAATSNAVPVTETAVVSRIPAEPVRDIAVQTVKNRPPPASQAFASPAISGRTPRANKRPNEAAPTISMYTGSAPSVATTQLVSNQAPSVPAPSETRSVLVPSEPETASRLVPVNMNWRIMSGEVVGLSRRDVPSTEAASDDRSPEVLRSGISIADGSFRVPGVAVVSPGSGAGLVRFHGATGRLGGEEAGYWISLLTGSLDWEECDGGTIVCVGLRLRGVSQARFSVVMEASEIRITVVSGRVHVTGAGEPTTLNSRETIVIARDGQARLGEIRRVTAATSSGSAATGEVR